MSSKTRLYEVLFDSFNQCFNCVVIVNRQQMIDIFIGCIHTNYIEEHKQFKYLLHGDTGVHNFVFNNEKVAGVIDPSPMIGPIIYDFTYAFCSSPDDLDLETLRTSFSCLHNVPIDEARLIEEVVVQLYTRIGICAKVHPQDLEQYLKAWQYWKTMLKAIA